MSYTVTVKNSGKTFTTEAPNSILDDAIEQGVNLAYGCRNGYCGVCRGTIVEGEISYGEYEPTNLLPDEKEAGVALLCKAVATSDLVIDAQEIVEASELEIKKYPVKVAKLEKLSEDVMRVFLKLPDGDRMEFFAGQYLNIILEDGGTKAFSISNPPHRDELIELHIKHIPNGKFTTYVFEEMQEKELLRIEAPLGTFYLREDSEKPIIMVAGGTGFAPLQGIIEHAFAEHTSRKIQLYWGARKQEDLYLNAQLIEWAAQHDNFTYTPVLEGYVHEAVLTEHSSLAGYEVYAAGPPAMVQAVEKTFVTQGLDKESLYYDSFDFS